MRTSSLPPASRKAVGGAAAKSALSGSSTDHYGGGEDARHVSKLEAEVLRLEARGTALVQTEGQELQGIELLEKAMRTRARFGTINTDAWQRAEQFVIVCNQLAVRAMQRLDDGYVGVANHLMAAAERTLCNTTYDPFVGFHPLRQALLGATLCNSAALCVLNGQPAEDALTAADKAIGVEAPRPSTLSLFNRAAVLVRLSRFDEAMETAVKVIALADHYLRLHVNLNAESEQVFAVFTMEAASHAVLAHHLICAVAQWSNQKNIAQHHARLAVRCAERFLGEHHALTTRAVQRAHAVTEYVKGNAPAVTDPNTPPAVPLQMATFSTPYPTSRLLPFTLVAPIPAAAAVEPSDSGSLPAIFTSPEGKTAGHAASTDAKRAAKKAPAMTSRPSTMQRASPRGAASFTSSGANGLMLPSIKPGTASASTRPTRSQAPASARDAALPAPGTTRPLAAKPPATGRPLRQQPAPGGSTASATDVKPVPPPGVNQSGRSSRATSNRDDADTVTTIGSANAHPSPVTPDVVKTQDPVIEAWGTPRAVTTVAKLDYDMYRAIQEEVAGFLHTATHQQPQPPQQVSSPHHLTATSGAAAGGATPRHGKKFATGALGFGDSDVETAIAVSDDALQRLSEVRPDHTDDDEKRWEAAARRLQRFGRLVIAKLSRERRARVVARHLRQQEATLRLQDFFRVVTLRTEAKRIITERRRIRNRNAAFERTIQASARAWLSYEEYCKRVVSDLEGQVAALKRATRQTVAATYLQSVWRSYLVRRRIEHHMASAAKVQRFYRLSLAFRIVRLIVYRRRSEVRAVWKKQDSAALRIQRWWKHFIKQVKAIRERKHRQAAVAAMLDVKVSRESLAWRRVAGVDEDVMARILQRSFRAMKWRTREHERQTSMRQRREASSKIQRCWRWSKASSIRERRREARVEQRNTRRRIEEVTEAALDMQRIARKFLARLRYHRLVATREQRVDAAGVLQRIVTVLRAMQRKTAQTSEVTWRAQRYMAAAERTYAATKIQSIYRMRRDRRFATEYRTFVTQDRHHLARMIQRAFRFYTARKVRQAIIVSRSGDRETRIRQELELQSARRIQHAFQSYEVRKATKRRAAVPVTRQAIAAARIQRVVRYVLARVYVSRLLHAREHSREVKRGGEHLAAYAVVIQAAVRRRLLMPKRIDAARQAYRVRACVRIQRFFRRAKALRQTATIRESRENDFEAALDVEETEFAAVRIQKIARGRKVRNTFSHQARAASRIARAFRVHRSLRIVDDLRQQRAASLRAQVDAEQNEAAATIQVAWRGRRKAV